MSTDPRFHLRQCASTELDRDDDALPCSREVLRSLRDTADQMSTTEALTWLAALYGAMCRKARQMADDSTRHGRR